MDFSTIRYEVQDHIATITLNRPDAKNALNGQMHQDLWTAWNDVRYNRDVWTVILTGEGDTFCAGEDLDEIGAALRNNGVPERYKQPQNGRLWGFMYEHYRLRKNNVWKPVVVAVNGPCQGTGLILVGQGDVILATENASFSCPDVSLGLVPVEETLYLADRVPLPVVLRMALMGDKETLSAQRAFEVSLASELLPPGELLDRARHVANTINDQAGDAVRAMAATMHIRRDFGYDDSLLVGYEYHQRFENVENMLEGPRAFTEKRKPQWTIRPPQMG